MTPDLSLIADSRPVDHEKETGVPIVTYVYDDGSEHTIKVAVATSLMRAALGNEVRGIVGECGGAATCGTCHVYLEDMNSTNGTYVNGARVSAQQQLRPGDMIRIGDTELRFDNG